MLREAHNIIDISPEISAGTAVFPGDTPFSRFQSVNFDSGLNFSLSKITTTLHIGAHADAPSHFHPKGEDIAKRSLSFYFGTCQVIEVMLQPGQRILPEHLRDKKVLATRVLFKTKSFPDSKQWNSDFNSLSPQLIEYLVAKGVILVGIDTPSIDLADDKILETHLKVHQYNLANLEGLELSHVSEGIYTLSAFPLRIVDGEASPVRAVLIQGLV